MYPTLCDFDLDSISRLLNSPERQPEYRRDRPHDEFLMNLPATIKTLKQKRRDAEKAADNTGKAPRQPTKDELRAEAEEEAPAILLDIHDAVTEMRRMAKLGAKGYFIVAELKENIARLPESVQRKILGENTAKIYGLPI